MNIISPIASFIQFGDVQLSDPNVYAYDFNLQEFANFNAAFQFAVQTDEADTDIINQTFYVGITDAVGALIKKIGTCSVLTYKTLITRFSGTIHLTSIEYGDTIKTYDEDVTITQLIAILLSDFDITATDDGVNVTVIESCMTDFVITDSSGILPITQLIDRLYANCNNVPMTGIVEPGQCYSYCIMNSENEVIATSQKLISAFKKMFLTTVVYQNSEDTFGFIYPANVVNRISLNLYISQPQYPATRKAYKTSTGKNILLSAVLDKQLQLQTDWMPQFFHDALNFALNHNNFQILEGAVFNGYVLDDAYKVTWVDTPEDKGQGSTKLKRQLYAYRNDDCSLTGDCCLPPYVILVSNVGSTLLFQLYPTVGQTQFQLRIAPQGSATWMIVTVTVADLVNNQYAIDYSSIGTAVQYEWNVLCSDGTWSAWTLPKNIGTPPPDCVVPGIEETTLPNAIEGRAYETEINLTGTAPFTLSNIVKPSWLTIPSSISENVITLSGTPGSGNVGETEVSFTVNNCSDKSALFDEGLTVINNIVITGGNDINRSTSPLSGTITGTAGELITVEMVCGGSGTFSYNLTVSGSGVSASGTADNSTTSATFTFTMPSSGTVNWSATFTSSDDSSSGSFTAS